ncbi:SCP2 sterol-binding domain-containing protein [Micromonospora coxensis]|uniref:SCP2 sterol-binding domain-containing protein n=1 Tax=Micromonospora coxensis TaxID=356852 RepID=UPI00341EA396
MSVAEYLERLSPGRRPELPRNTVGTIRFDVRQEGRTEHWRLAVRDQRIEVTRAAGEADLVVRADREVFDRLAGGDRHPVQALLRNELTVRGDMRLFMTLRRIFPGPPGARHPREVTAGTGAGR